MTKPVVIDMRSDGIYRAPTPLKALVGIAFLVGFAALSIAGLSEMARLSPLAQLYGYWTSWHASHGCSRTIDA